MILNILPVSPSPLSGYLSTNSGGYLAAAQSDSDQQSFYLIRFILLLIYSWQSFLLHFLSNRQPEIEFSQLWTQGRLRSEMIFIFIILPNIMNE